jgi:hypothetical protein
MRSRMAGSTKGLDSAEKLKDRTNRNRSHAFDALLILGLPGGGCCLMYWAIHHPFESQSATGRSQAIVAFQIHPIVQLRVQIRSHLVCFGYPKYRVTYLFD